MRSQLTRSVFRRLLSHEGLLFHCPRQAILTSPYRSRNGSSTILRAPQRRNLWGFSNKPQRQQKIRHIPPGLEIMLELSHRLKVNEQPPATAKLIDGWKLFLTTKSKNKEPMLEYQAKAVLQTFNHLEAEERKGKQGLTREDMSLASIALRFIPKDKTEPHNQLARLLYPRIYDMSHADSGRWRCTVNFIKVLAETGDALEARELLRNALALASQVYREEPKRREKERWLFNVVLQGLCKEDNAEEVVKTIEVARSVGVPYHPSHQTTVVEYFASKNDVETTKKYFNMPTETLSRSSKPHSQSLMAILQLCIRKQELEWSRELFRGILEGSPNKLTWDVVLQWAAGVMGKGVEDVDRMMDIMIKRNLDNEGMRPDIETINGLAEMAVSLKDPYLAERYIALGLKRGIQPNAATLILQMNYRTDANDLPGTRAAYEALLAEEVLDDADLPAINKYIRALCIKSDANYEQIKYVTTNLEERKKRLEAETTVALANVYLRREETEDLEDLLNTHAYLYSLGDRRKIIDAFMNFCLNRNNSTKRAWEAYSLLRSLFDETPIDLRTQLMNEFFERGRCDMACHTFGHMRQHSIQDRRPVAETYVLCFEGIAKAEDSECLDMVHNMMKMDSNIEPNTKLYNALMLAYIGCEDFSRALSFWDDITNSEEGPSYRSLEIVFKACARKPFGDMKAREIWTQMRRMEIEVTGEVFAAYVGALAGQVKYEEARDMVENMEKDLNLEPDVLT